MSADLSNYQHWPVTKLYLSTTPFELTFSLLFLYHSVTVTFLSLIRGLHEKFKEVL